MNYREKYELGATFDNYLMSTQKHADLWKAIYLRARVSAADIAAIEATQRRWHLLVISEDWCGDAVNTVPVVARLAEQSGNVDLRVISRDGHPDVMDLHLSPRGGRAIPVVIVLDEEFQAVGWWGSRPSELQRWYDTEGRDMAKDLRYRHVRTWYARDRGATVVSDIVAIITGGQSRRAVASHGTAAVDTSADDARRAG